MSSQSCFRAVLAVLSVIFWQSVAFSTPPSGVNSNRYLVQIVALKTETPVSKFSELEKIVYMSPGSAFRIKTADGSVWITAAHVIDEVQKLGGDFYLLSPEQSSIQYTQVRDLFKIMDTGVEKINARSILHDKQIKYDGDRGDFAYFKSPDGAASGLELRDLSRQPLVIGEKIEIAGRHWGQGERRVDCKYIGLRPDSFARGSLQMLLDCNESFLGPNREVQLGSVSGAATLDSQGRVVGVFAGFVSYRDKSGKDLTLLRSTLIFVGANGIPQITPKIDANSSLPFTCVAFDKVGLVANLISTPAVFQKPCAIENH